MVCHRIRLFYSQRCRAPSVDAPSLSISLSSLPLSSLQSIQTNCLSPRFDLFEQISNGAHQYLSNSLDQSEWCYNLRLYLWRFALFSFAKIIILVEIGTIDKMDASLSWVSESTKRKVFVIISNNVIGLWSVSMQQNNINLEIKWFLSVLKFHSRQTLQLDENSLNELAAIVSNIGTLIGDANVVAAENSHTDDSEFYQRIRSSDDCKYFQFDHFVTCRICHVSKMDDLCVRLNQTKTISDELAFFRCKSACPKRKLTFTFRVESIVGMPNYKNRQRLLLIWSRVAMKPKSTEIFQRTSSTLMRDRMWRRVVTRMVQIMTPRPQMNRLTQQMASVRTENAIQMHSNQRIFILILFGNSRFAVSYHSSIQRRQRLQK